MKDFKIVSILFSAVLYFGCKSASTPLPVQIRVTNASPDAPAFDLMLNNISVVQSLQYGADSGYKKLLPGAYDMQLFQTGNTSPLFSNTLYLAANKYYSLFMVDSFKKLQLAFIEDDFTPPPLDSMYIRYFDLSPNAPIHNARFLNTADTFAFNDRAFNDELQSGKSTFIKMKAGNYCLQLTPTDTTLPFRTFDSVALAAGGVYTIYLKGFYDSTNTSTPDKGIINHNQ